jgi:putative ABC transport system permease protein
MTRLREWIDRLLGTLRRGRSDADLEAELRSHLELAAELEGRPIAAPAAVAVTHAMDGLRLRRGLPWLHALSADVVFGWRQLNRHRVVSAAAIVSLGLAMGATTAAFRLVDAVLLRPLPVNRPERLAYGIASFVDAQGRLDYYDSFDYPSFVRYAEMVGDRADVMVVGSASTVEAIVGGVGDPERLNRQHYSGNVFGVFGLRPALGRLIGPDDDRTPGAHPVAVLAHDYWRRRFGGDPRVLGTIIRIGHVPYQVIGVAPARFVGTEPGRSADLFVPATMNVEALDKPGWGWFGLWIRPHAGTTLASVEQILQADFERRLRDDLKNLPPDTPQSRIDARLRERLSLLPAASGVSKLQKTFRRPLIVLAWLVAAVLLVACVNVANLLNGQAVARRRELALRVSIGAGRWRLIRLMLVESALLALQASAVGALFGWWAAPFVVSMLTPPQDPIRLAMEVDWRVVSFGVALAFVVTAIFGLLPALRASALAPHDVLKTGGRGITHPRLTRGLIGLQTAFCVFVLFVTVLFVTTFARLAAWPLGFRAEGLMFIDAEAKATSDGDLRWAPVEHELRALPGVTAVARAGWAPLSGSRWRWDVRVPGQPPQPDAPHFLAVSPGYFSTLEIPLLDGRDVRAGERAADVDEQGRPNDGIGVVNQAFARTYFGGRSPVGARVRVQVRPQTWASIEIVGLVGDTVYASLRDPLRPAVYVPANQRGGATLMVRTAGDPAALGPVMRRLLARARPDARIRMIGTQQELVVRQVMRERLLAMLSLFVAAVALLLSAIGLYGVLHHAVVLQQRQIGIRMALGARAAHVVRQVTGGLLASVAAGAAGGLAGGLLFGRLIESLLFRVAATDAGALATPLAVLAAASLLASLPPAMRAARIDPALTLRAE